MAGSNEIRAGGAYVEFATRGKEVVERTMQQIQKRMQGMAATTAIVAAGVGAMGASVVAPFAHGLHVYSETAAQISRIARETGFTREQVSGLTYALDADAEALPQAAASIARFINEAYTNPSSDAARAINEMNLRLEDLTGADRREQLMRVADGLASIGNETRRATVAGVVGLNPAVAGRLGGGRAQVEARIERGRELGAVRPGAELEQMEEYNRTFRDMSVAIKGLWESIGAAARPVMQRFYEIVTMIVVKVREFIDANRPLLTVIFAVADLTVTIAATIGGIASGILVLATALGGAAAVLPFLIVGIKVLAIAIAVVVSAGVQIYTAFQIAQSVLALFGTSVSDVFNRIATYFAGVVPMVRSVYATVLSAWEGIMDAISAGDMTLVWEIVKAAAVVAWEQIKAYGIATWIDLKFDAIAAWNMVKDRAIDAMASAWTEVKLLWADVLDFYENETGNSVTGTVAFFARSWFNASWSMAATLIEAWGAVNNYIIESIGRIASSLSNTFGGGIMAMMGMGSNEEGPSFIDSAREAAAEAANRVLGPAGGVAPGGRRAMVEEEANRNAEQRLAERQLRDAELAMARADEGTSAAAEAGANIFAAQARLDALNLDAWIAAEQRRIQGNMDELPSGPGAAYDVQRQLSVQGTFNAAAVYGFAGAPMSNTERIAEATRDELTRVREVLERIAARDGLAMG